MEVQVMVEEDMFVLGKKDDEFELDEDEEDEEEDDDTDKDDGGVDAEDDAS